MFGTETITALWQKCLGTMADEHAADKLRTMMEKVSWLITKKKILRKGVSWIRYFADTVMLKRMFHSKRIRDNDVK